MKAYRKDFYEAVNQEWLNQAEIPEDKPAYSAFEEISESIQRQLMDNFAQMTESGTTPAGPLGQFLSFYQMESDWETRNALGGEPLRPYLDEIAAIETVEQLDAKLSDWSLMEMDLPVNLGVTTDAQDAMKNALYASPPSNFLPIMRQSMKPAPPCRNPSGR